MPPGAGTGPSTTPDRAALEIRVEFEGEVSSIWACGGESVLDAAERHGLHLPRVCRQGWCISCAARVVDGVADHSSARRFFPEDEAAGFALLCCARPLTAMVVIAGKRVELRDHRIRNGLPVPRS